ncbi:hypothetical protein ACES2L_01775 [Bdellovibrio bacteriovorus]
MNSFPFLASAIAERNRAAQGVRRDLSETDVPQEILSILQQPNKKSK